MNPMNKAPRSSRLSLLISSLIAISTNTAYSAPALEEVVVTAQKREESLQEVPGAISAFSSADIEDAGWQDVDKLQEIMPSVNVGGESLSKPFIFIRGVGTRKFDIGADGSVGIFVDEVYSARFSSALSGIMDLERIEVLKGPQGTLYGRNTIGGAINMFSKKPTDEFEGRIKAATGNDDFYSVGASVSGPLIEDVLSGRLGVVTSDVNGAHKDTVSGATNNNKVDALRASLYATPSERLELAFTADVNNVESDAILVEANHANGHFLLNPTLPNVATALAETSSDPYSNAYTTPGGVDRDSNQLSFKAKWSGDNIEFTSISSRTDEDMEEIRDFDADIFDVWTNFVEQSSTQYSQELRFSSVDGGKFSFDDRLQWVMGVYYFEDDAERSDAYPLGPDSVLPPAEGEEFNNSTVAVDLDTQSYAAYVQGT